MSTPKMTRGEFLRGGSYAAAGAILGNMVLSDAAPCQGPCGAGTQANPGGCASLGKITLRPYQLLCVFCAVGEKGSTPTEGPLARTVIAIQKNPDVPVTLCCNAGDVYVYQDPGTGEDTPEGSDYNRKRDRESRCRPGCSWGTC